MIEQYNYICPDCGTVMDVRERRELDGTLACVNVRCPRCCFALTKDWYDFIYSLGKFGAAKLPPKPGDKGKRERNVNESLFHAINGSKPEDGYDPQYAFEKPPLGCKPYYVYIGPRIEDLCNAIVRCYADGRPNHNKIALWCKEILCLNEMYRNLRYDEKCKVWKEDKDGTLKEMP